MSYTINKVILVLLVALSCRPFSRQTGGSDFKYRELIEFYANYAAN